MKAPPNIEGWLCNATKFVLKRYWRDKVRMYITEDDADELLAILPDSFDFPTELEDEDYTRWLLTEIPKCLSFDDRDLFELKVHKKFTNEEISQKLGQKRTTIDKRVTRMRKKIEKILENFQ